ncbi:MAG TPA: carbon-nitrogen hydrolase family protein [Chitinophagaceae bacterium]|nr:carbon-nitrogen hydrolase family protein [Chitinophagaceae bacterium]
MKIATAQTKPVKGNIEANIAAHKKLISLAAEEGAGIIVFPELSLTGYEPELAKELATTKDNSRFNGLQQLSNTHNITICAGMPIKAVNGVMIGLLIFSPGVERRVYCKQHLHADELPYFICGHGQEFLQADGYTIGLAICYEISVQEHAASLFAHGAGIYAASVAKSTRGMEQAVITLAGIARTYSVPVLLSNCVGHCDNFDCGGKTSAWGSSGSLLRQLDDNSEGIIVFDTATQAAIQKTI